VNKWWLLLLAFPVLAADLQREARWANEIEDAILVGEPEWLQSGDHRFLAIYTEAEGEARHGAVLLMHGSGVHPDWPEVINPLRERGLVRFKHPQDPFDLVGPGTALAERFAPVAEQLAADEARIVEELNAAQGSPQDIGGYYRPDPDRAAAAMRPSAALNGIIEAI